MSKKIYVAFLSMLVLILVSCTHNIDYHENIKYPKEPYSLDDHPLVNDEYAFYDISGSQVKYWGAANVHDPVMIKEDDTFYIFSTDAQFGVTSQKGIHIRKTKDFIKYDYVGTALDLTSVNDAINYVEYNRDGERVDFFWAPEIVKRPKEDGSYEYWLFYSNSSFGQRTSYMGLAKSDSIEGPYIHDREILRTHQSVGSPNAIDPAVFVEEVDGVEKMWLSYGSWSAGIYVIELNPETGEPLIKQTLVEEEVAVNTEIAGQTIIKTKTIPVANDPAFGTRILNIHTAEAPYIIKENDYYYLFVTTGTDLTYDYDARVFRSKSILGPYIDAQGNGAISSSNRDNFRNYGNKITDAHQFITEEKVRGWAGIGHSAAYKDGDQWLFLSHYRGTYIDKDRFFFGVRAMHFVNDWPVLEANRFIYGGSKDLSKANISGNYQIHLLEKNRLNSSLNNNIISIIKKAENIVLTEEKVDNEWNLIEGDYEGKWRFDNKNLEIIIDNISYIGVITPQWNFESHQGVLSFSLIDESGTTIWGNRIIEEKG